MRSSVIAASACVLLLAACADKANHGAQSSSAPPASSAAPSTVPLPTSYQVEPGDTLGAIAKRFGVTVDAIVAASHLSNRDQLTVGQVLMIPPAPPVGLNVSPPDGPPGTTVQLTVTGAHNGESITFEVDSPSGAKFTGPPHTASSDGSVTATYQTTPQNPLGTYTVTAKGSQGTNGQGSFNLSPPPTSSQLN